MGWGDLSDKQLVERARAGDKSAFEELFHRHQDGVYRLARARAASDEAALDLVQEVFLKAYRELKDLRSGSSFRAWTYRICLNLAASRARSEGRRLRAESLAMPRPEGTVEPIQAMMREETLARLRALLRRLPRLMVDTLLLREVEGLSYKEISKVMNCSEKAVEMRLFRARGKLLRAWIALEAHDELP